MRAFAVSVSVAGVALCGAGGSAVSATAAGFVLIGEGGSPVSARGKQAERMAALRITAKARIPGMSRSIGRPAARPVASTDRLGRARPIIARTGPPERLAVPSQVGKRREVLAEAAPILDDLQTLRACRLRSGLIRCSLDIEPSRRRLATPVCRERPRGRRVQLTLDGEWLPPSRVSTSLTSSRDPVRHPRPPNGLLSSPERGRLAPRAERPPAGEGCACRCCAAPRRRLS